MKKQLYKRLIVIVIICIAATNILECAIIVKGNDTNAPFGFATKIGARALDPASGIFYVGLASGTDKYTLSKIGRYSGQSCVSFTGFAPSDLQSGINYLTLSCAPDNKSAARLVGSDSAHPTQVFILKSDGSPCSLSGSLNDANGEATSGVVGVAASSKHIVAAVKPTSGSFGDENSGLALITINNKLQLTTLDATTGNTGNKAVQLDNTSEVFTGIPNGNVTITPPSPAGGPEVLYDKDLDRFYIGVTMKSGNANEDIAKSVTVACINNNNSLELQEIAPNNAINNSNNQIVVTKGSMQNLTVQKMGILHASTGPTYLIVAGGNGDGNTNTVYALPLVNNDEEDNEQEQEQGTLAKFDADLDDDGRFTMPAMASGDIPTNSMTSAKVGSTTLPIAIDTTPITDMVVLGDAVYVSTSAEDEDDNDEPGIFYSHALFDAEGKIAAWTPWTKKALPINAFPGKELSNNAPHDGDISFFQVDAANGKIWFVEGTTQQTVGTTAWTAPRYAQPNSLAQKLTATFPHGVHTALDLDQSTRCLGNTSPARYALFGGSHTVAFARTSITNEQSPSINSPQEPINDFSDSKNFLVTTLPDDAGCCQALEYARQNTTTNKNYFFAGTSNGLYVFADSNKSGFTLDMAVNELNEKPFNGQWFKASNIAGSVVALKTTGNKLYILTQEFTPTFKSTVYSVAYSTDVTSMFATPVVLAQTGQHEFTKVGRFNDLGIVSIDATGSQEQLILATSKGLYKSTIANGVQGAAAIADALWILMDDTTPYQGITCTDNTPINTACTNTCATVPTTVWPFNLIDPTGNKLFNKSTIQQVTNTGNTVEFVPPSFTNANSTASFKTLYPITHFFTDGARRFFVTQSPDDPCKNSSLTVLPFDTELWNIDSQEQVIVRDPQLSAVQAIYWIQHIGATGSILMGTDKGVYTLD